MGSSKPGGQARPSRFGKITLCILDLGVFAGTFLFRWLTVQFPNDHFQHLSRARQILLGDVPVRDFFDAGFFLQNYLSSAFQLAFGHTLFGEAVLTVSFVALGTMLVFHLSARLSGSRWLAAGAALLTVVAYPRLHSYPKVFLYVSAIGLAWLYARRSGRWQVSLMALLTAVAFLLRHDHGVYIAVMMVCFLGLHEWGSAQFWRRLGQYAGVTVGLLLPFLIFVQMTTGLVAYIGGSGPQAQMVASYLPTFLSNPVTFEIDRSAPFWVIEPATGPVNVRWAEVTDDAARREREMRYGLTAGVRQRVDGLTWSYVLTNRELENLRALIQDPMVDDTAGIDRGTFQVLPERWESWLKRKLVVLRLRGLRPGVLTPRNALAWFYYLTILVPVVVLVRVGAAWRSGRVARPEAAVMAAAAIVCCIISHTLVRGRPDTYLPDVAAPTFILAAWLAHRRSDLAGPPVRARLARAGMAGLFLVTFWSVWNFGAAGTSETFGSLLASSGVRGGPVGVWRQFGVVTRRLRDRPIDTWAPPDSTGSRALTRYVFDCTAPSDRVFVTWFAPEVFYLAERGFAGGQSSLVGGWHASVADQRLTIERMQRQSVPIILGRRDLLDLFRRRFPLIHDYVQTRYRLAAESRLGEEESFLIYVDARRNPVAQHPDLGLPCYR